MILKEIEKGCYSLDIRNAGYEQFFRHVWRVASGGLFAFSELTDRQTALEVEHDLKQVGIDSVQVKFKYPNLLAGCGDEENYWKVLSRLWPDELPAVDNIYLISASTLVEAEAVIQDAFDKDGDVDMDKVNRFLLNKFILRNESDGVIALLYTFSGSIKESFQELSPS